MQEQIKEFSTNDASNQTAILKYNRQFHNLKLDKIYNETQNVKQLNTKSKFIKVLIDCASDGDSLASICNLEVLIFVKILILLNLISQDSFSNRLQGQVQYFWNPLFIFRSIQIADDFQQFQDLIIKRYKAKVINLQEQLSSLEGDDWNGKQQQLVQDYQDRPKNKRINTRYQLAHKIQHLLHFVEEIQEKKCDNHHYKRLKRGIWNYANTVYELLDKTSEENQQSSILFANDRSDLAHFDATALGVSLFHYKLLQPSANKFYYNVMNLPRITYISFKKSWDELTSDVMNYLPYDKVETLNSLQTIVIQDSSFDYAPYNLHYQTHQNDDATRPNTFKISIDQLKFKKHSHNPTFQDLNRNTDISSEDILYLFERIIYPLVRQHNPGMIILNHNFSYSSECLPKPSLLQNKYILDPKDYASIVQSLGIICNQKLIMVSNNKISDFVSEFDLFSMQKESQKTESKDIDKESDYLNEGEKSETIEIETEGDIKQDKIRVKKQQRMTKKNQKAEDKREQKLGVTNQNQTQILSYKKFKKNCQTISVDYQRDDQNIERTEAASIQNRIATKSDIGSYSSWQQNNKYEQYYQQTPHFNNTYQPMYYNKCQQLQNNGEQLQVFNSQQQMQYDQFMNQPLQQQGYSLQNKIGLNSVFNDCKNDVQYSQFYQQYINRQMVAAPNTHLPNYQDQNNHNQLNLHNQSLQILLKQQSIPLFHQSANSYSLAINPPMQNQFLLDQDKYQGYPLHNYQQVHILDSLQQNMEQKNYNHNNFLNINQLIMYQANNMNQQKNNNFDIQSIHPLQLTLQTPDLENQYEDTSYNTIQDHQLSSKTNLCELQESHKESNKYLVNLMEFQNTLLSKPILSYQGKLLCFHIEQYIKLKIQNDKVNCIEQNSNNNNNNNEDIERRFKKLSFQLRESLNEMKQQCEISSYVRNWQLEMLKEKKEECFQEIIKIQSEKQYEIDVEIIKNDFNIENQKQMEVIAQIYTLFQKQSEKTNNLLQSFSLEKESSEDQTRIFSKNFSEYFLQLVTSSIYAACEIKDISSSFKKKSAYLKNVSPIFSSYIDTLHTELINLKNRVNQIIPLEVSNQDSKSDVSSCHISHDEGMICNQNTFGQSNTTRNHSDNDENHFKVQQQMLFIADQIDAEQPEQNMDQEAEQDRIDAVIDIMSKEASQKALLFKYGTKIKGLKHLNALKVTKSKENKIINKDETNLQDNQDKVNKQINITQSSQLSNMSCSINNQLNKMEYRQADIKTQERLNIKRVVASKYYDEIFDVRRNKTFKLRFTENNNRNSLNTNTISTLFYVEQSQYQVIYLPNGLLEVYLFNIPYRSHFRHAILTQSSSSSQSEQSSDVFDAIFIPISSQEATFSSSLCYNDEYVFKLIGLNKMQQNNETNIEAISRLTKQRILIKLDINDANKDQLQIKSDFSSACFKKDGVTFITCYGGLNSSRMLVSQVALLQVKPAWLLYSCIELLNKDFFLQQQLEQSKFQQNQYKVHDSISALQSQRQQQMEKEKNSRKLWKKIPQFFIQSLSVFDDKQDCLYVIGGNANHSDTKQYKSSFITSAQQSHAHCWENSLNIVKIERVSENLSLKEVLFVNLDVVSKNNIKYHNYIYNKHCQIGQFPFEILSRLDEETNPYNLRQLPSSLQQDEYKDGCQVKSQFTTQYRHNNTYINQMANKKTSTEMMVDETNQEQLSFVIQSCTHTLPKTILQSFTSANDTNFILQKQNQTISPKTQAQNYQITSMLFSFQTDLFPSISIQMKQ